MTSARSLHLLAVIEAKTITGPAKNLLDFVRVAASDGVRTTIATFVRSEGGDLFLDSLRKNGIPVETIPERGAYDREAIRGLASLMDRLQPDIVQTHAVKSHFLARCAGVPLRLPWVAFHHGYTWPDFKARLHNQVDRWSLRAARKVLTVSVPFRDELVTKGVSPDRIEIVHNAIRQDWGLAARAPESVSALRASMGIGADRKVVLIVGRLSREKDHITLLDAFRGVLERRPSHLVIVGDGPERKRIEARAAELKISGSVTLAGQVDSAEPYYGIADLAVLSSLSEGSPNALLEAMAAGVPAVATAVGGIPEIVENGRSALLIPPSQAEAMRRAILSVLEDPPLAHALARNSRQLVLERHSPEARAGRLCSIYRDILSQAVRE
jgi:glycosyltransferase involved in cell wall biosynthesis